MAIRRQHFSYRGTPDGAGASPLLHGTIWYPAEDTPIRAVVMLVHGMDEHIGRYESFACTLCGNGIVTAGIDLRGHGRSVGEDGIFGSFSAHGNGWQLAMIDLYRLRTKLRTMFPGLPCFLLGHSMGSFFVRAMTMADPEVADGYMLSGTAYHDAATLEAGRALCQAVIKKNGRTAPMTAVIDASCVLNNLFFHPLHGGYDWVCADPAAVLHRGEDPLCNHTPTAGLCDDMLQGLLAVCAGSMVTRRGRSQKDEGAKIPRLPVLLISGSMDPIGDYGRGVQKTAALLRFCGSLDVTVRLYRGARHEVLLDTCRETVHADVLAWIDAHIS